MNEKITNRIAELKAYEGKSFIRKADPKGLVFTVLKYDGVKVKDGVSAHTFLVEGKDMRWTPIASKFLEEYELVEVPAKTATSEEPI